MTSGSLEPKKESIMRCKKLLPENLSAILKISAKSLSMSTTLFSFFYSRFNKIKNCSDKALSGTCLDSLYFGADLSGNRPSQLRRLGGSSLHFALLRSGTAAQAVQHRPGLSAFFSGQSASHKKRKSCPKSIVHTVILRYIQRRC